MLDALHYLVEKSDEQLHKLPKPILKQGQGEFYEFSTVNNPNSFNVSDEQDAKELDDAQRYRDHQTDMRCYE